MVQSDEGRLGIAVLLAFLMHQVAVPRQDEGRMGMQHPARRHLSGEGDHPEEETLQMASDEDGTSL